MRTEERARVRRGPGRVPLAVRLVPWVDRHYAVVAWLSALVELGLPEEHLDPLVLDEVALLARPRGLVVDLGGLVVEGLAHDLVLERAVGHVGVDTSQRLEEGELEHLRREAHARGRAKA